LQQLIHGAYRGNSARQGWTHEAELVEGQRISVEMLQEILADSSQRILLAEQDRQLVGCIQIADRADGLAYIGLLTVEPVLQRRGIAKRLLAAAERLARIEFAAQRIEMMVIRQRSELISYYARRGYKATGEERPFPVGDERFGVPRRQDVAFGVLIKQLG
jgi:GNAT superfamily N-acetyltransferase